MERGCVEETSFNLLVGSVGIPLDPNFERTCHRRGESVRWHGPTSGFDFYLTIPEWSVRLSIYPNHSNLTTIKIISLRHVFSWDQGRRPASEMLMRF